MIATVSPSDIHGIVLVPPSKSAMQRACALALLNKGITIINNPGKSNDDLAALAIIRNLGAGVVEEESGSLLIRSTGIVKPRGDIHCGESGLSLRMFTPLVTLGGNVAKITGEGSLLKRPVDFFLEVFPQLGIKVQSVNGLLPLEIEGKLKPASIAIDGSVSSQFLTGLLFAFASETSKQVTITVTNLKSKPYIDLSLDMLRHFGYRVDNHNYTSFIIYPVLKNEKMVIYDTEGDWSGAAFLLVAAAIKGQVTASGILLDSAQADKAILDVLHLCGITVECSSRSVKVTAPAVLLPFSFDATDCPDLFPPLAALAAYCKGTSVIKGTSRLKAKESDRAYSLSDVFTKLGVPVELREDEMHITGGQPLLAVEVNGHHDHRIVMAAAVAALGAQGKVSITGAEAVNKSYPTFFEQLQKVGAHISLSDK